MLKLLIPILILVPLLLRSQQRERPDFDIALRPVYQQNELSWSIAGNINGQNPNIFSELTWNKVQGTGVHLGLNARLVKDFWIKAAFTRTWTISGTVTDTDYQEDDRRSPSFSASLSSDKGFTKTYSLGLKREFDFKRWTFAPAVSYVNSSQRFYLIDDNNLNSTYDPHWRGISFDLDITRKLLQELDICAGLAYQFYSYNAVADWNLIEDFEHPVSFDHKANGRGVTYFAGVAYPLGKIIQLSARASHQLNSTGRGVDRLFLASGGTSVTRLNNVTQNQFQLSIGIGIFINQIPFINN